MTEKTDTAPGVDGIVALIDERVMQFATKMTELGEKYGENVAEIAFAAFSLEGFSILLMGVLFAVISASSYVLLRFSAKRWNEYLGDKDGWGCLWFASAFISIVTGILSLTHIFNAWAWFAIFWPEVAAAHHILGL